MNNRKLTSLLLTVLSISVFSIVGANSIDDSVTGDIRKEAYVNGVIYQESAEVKGLQKQAYTLATLQLDRILSQKKDINKPLAIISDIDQTIMDDTKYQAEMLLSPGAWDNGPWDGYYKAIGTEANVALPGAVDFFNDAKSKGVSIFYITNRDHDTVELTVAELAHAGLPYADKEHVLVMDPDGSSNKDSRRAKVLENYDVVMYLGDNIGDFTSAFKREYGAIKRTELATAPEYINNWGTIWIVLPNSTYGDYVGAVWNNEKNANRIQASKDLLEYYRYTNPRWKKWYGGKIKE